MNLACSVELYAGGPGSGCRGTNCGRKVQMAKDAAYLQNANAAYHTTPASNVPSILKNGIRVGGGNLGDGVYAFKSLASAKGYFGSFGHPKGSAVVVVKPHKFESAGHEELLSSRPISKREIIGVFVYKGADGRAEPIDVYRVRRK